MSWLIDISRIIGEASEHCGADVALGISANSKEFRFSFEWTSSQSVHNLKYHISNFEIKMISLDVNDVVIGFFKSKVNRNTEVI